MKPKFTEQEITIIKERYSTTLTRELAEQLGRSTYSVNYWAYKLGLKKTAEYLKSRSHDKFIQQSMPHRFVKGQVPWNKGLSYHVPNNRTRFRKGNKPHQTKYDGCISIRHDKDLAYKYIRISESKWVPLHQKIWTDANGPIPSGHMVVFKDRTLPDREKLENLELISTMENMKRNTKHNYPKELQEVIAAHNQLKKILNGKKNIHE